MDRDFEIITSTPSSISLSKLLSRREFAIFAGMTGMLAVGIAGKRAIPAWAGEVDQTVPTNGVDQVDKLRFVTGGESGTYYAVGNVIAQRVSNNTDVKVTALSGNGSQANVVALEDNEAELAFCQSDVMSYAYEGTNLFSDTGAVDCFSTLGALYQEQVQIVTCDPDIKTVADLAGKTVSIGAKGSGVYFNALYVLAAYGMDEDSINPAYQSAPEAMLGFEDGSVDATFIVAGTPTSLISDKAMMGQAYLVGLDDAHIDELLRMCTYYSKATIPAGTYDSQDEDIETVAVLATVIVRDDVSEDAVYTITSQIFDNLEVLAQEHPKLALCSVEAGASIASVPYHPGAARYFAEQGYAVPTKETSSGSSGAPIAQESASETSAQQTTSAQDKTSQQITDSSGTANQDSQQGSSTSLGSWFSRSSHL